MAATLPIPAGLDAHRRAAPLIGREVEVAALHADWLAARSGRRRVAVVAGEPGIGKTRLAAELAGIAHADGASVLFGGCSAEAIVPYQPIVEALQPAARHNPSIAGPALAPLLPALVPSGPADLADAATSRFRMFQAVTSALRAITAEKPAVLVLDDLQWADGDTVALIRHVVRTTEQVPLLIIATVRDTDVEARHPLRDLLAELRADREGHRTALRGLSLEAVAQLGQSIAGHTPGSRDQRSASAIHARSHGNPLFAAQLWAHVLAGREGLPDGIEVVVHGRVRTLDDGDGDVLKVAALIGGQFDIDVLASASERASDDVEAVLERATGAQLVREAGAGHQTYEFVHDLVREVLAADVFGPRRQQSHQRIAAAIAGHRGDDRPVEVAHHLLLARPLGDAATLATVAREAAARAGAAMAWHEQARFAEGAAVAATEAGWDAPERAELLIDCGVARGRTSDLDAALEALHEAFELATTAGEASLAARAVMWRTTFTILLSAAGTPIDAAALTAVRLRVTDLDPAVGAELLSHLAHASWTSGHFDEADDAAEQALALGGPNASAAGSRAEASLGATAWFRLDLAGAAHHFRRAVDQGRVCGDPWLLSSPQARLAITLLWRGELEAAGEQANLTIEATDSDGNVSSRAIASGALTAIAALKGDPVEALEHANESRDAAATIGYDWFAPLLAATTAGLLIDLGRWPEAGEWLHATGPLRTEAFGGGEDNEWLIRMRGAALRGDTAVVDEAGKHPARLTGRVGAMVGSTQQLTALADVAELSDGRIPIAIDRVQRRLGRIAERGLVVAEGSNALVQRSLAQAARMAFAPEVAAAALRAATAWATQAGALVELARCTLEAAHQAARRDPGRAAALYEESIARFTALGMAPWAAHATRSAERLTNS